MSVKSAKNNSIFNINNTTNIYKLPSHYDNYAVDID